MLDFLLLFPRGVMLFQMIVTKVPAVAAFDCCDMARIRMLSFILEYGQLLHLSHFNHRPRTILMVYLGDTMELIITSLKLCILIHAI